VPIAHPNPGPGKPGILGWIEETFTEEPADNIFNRFGDKISPFPSEREIYNNN